MSANNCPNCGNPMDPGATVCAKCGQGVAGSAPPRPAAAPPGRKLPIVPLLVLGAGILALLAALLLMRGGNPASGPTVVFNAATEPAVPTAAPAVASAAAPAAAQAVPRTVPPRVAAGARAASVPAVPAGSSSSAAPPRPTPPLAKVYECREGAIFGVDPEEALVTVNGKVIGKADDWDDAGGGKKYHFDGPGTYYVKFTLEKFATTWVKIVVKPDAEDKYATVDLGLKKDKDKDKDKDED
ncbi:MAG: zinc ribbon domain-containing protein [Thermoanaerobaculaceae bacterium]|nr:zinc ribbon domain-containing protein [Thermoanaerobaculaceae bacterium]TAM52024.1 MAG: zinc ribbon domain-containing protein [Acidobacteriota bacterium]